MSGLPHVDQVKTHFVSGEPGTTGREPFEESINSGKFLPDHLMGNTNSAPHIPSGSHVGTAPVGAGLGHDHGLGAHGAHGTTHDNNHGEKKGLGEKVKEAVGLDKDPAVNSGHHSSSTPTHATGAADISGRTGTGIASSTSHGSHGIHSTTYDNHSHGTTTGTTGEKKGLGEKVKEAVGLDKDPSTNSPKTSSSTTHNNRDHGVATGAAGVGAVGAGAGAYGATHGTRGTAHNSTDTNASYNRDVVDKINDALPGTPAKVPQAYQAGDQTTGVTGTQYGAGKHAGAGEGIHSGVGGVVSGGHGVAGTAHDDRMVDRAPESLDHKRDEPSKGGLSGVLGTSDKDFLSRNREGKGAYADTHGVTELNSSGPKGNPALTGREGDISKNPVAQKHGVAGAHDHESTTAPGEKKGLLQKIKDVL